MTNELATNELTRDSVLAVRLTEYAHAARGAFAPATVAAIAADTQAFADWCRDNGRAALPATPATVAEYVDARYAAGSAPASIRRYVASVGFMHRAAGVADPTKAEVAKLALKRMGRAAGTDRRSRQKQAPALNRPLVDRMLSAAGSGLRDKRNRALVAVGYDMFARRGEIAGLVVADLEFRDDGSGTALIARSKTDQEGKGAFAYLAPDTVRAVRDWLDAAGITEGPVFRPVRRGGQRAGAGPMRPVDVAEVLKELATAAGLDRVPTGHSLRVGAAQDATAGGMSTTQIQIAGRWQTATMPARYAAALEVRRGASALLAILQLRA